MFQVMFINMAVIISFLSIRSLLLKSEAIAESKQFFIKMSYGISGGILGIILILFSYKITPDILFDFRCIAIILAAIYGGFLPALVSGLIIAAFRLFYIGIDPVSIFSAAIILITSVACGLITKSRIQFLTKWVYMYLFYCTIKTFEFSQLLGSKSALGNTLVYIWVGNFVIVFLIYNLAKNYDTFVFLYKKYKLEALTDSLTGLSNVRFFNDKLTSNIEDAKIKHESLSLILFDIDHFKSVNDTYGHPAGDAILKELGSLIQSLSRKSDIISRIGGEEFTILLPHCNKALASYIAERIRAEIEQHNFILPDGSIIHITVSVGLAAYSDSTNSPEKIFNAVDKALYTAKFSGRNRIYSI